MSKEAYEQVQLRLRAQGPKSTGRVTVRRRHDYALKGLLFHDVSGRRMQGNWNHGKAHYRCRFPNEYAIGNELDHPLAVYVREDAILDPLDAWLAEVFSPGRVDDSLTMLESAQPDIALAQEDARRVLADCERKLTRHRAALEAGADPALVAAWSREVQRERPC